MQASKNLINSKNNKKQQKTTTQKYLYFLLQGLKTASR
jgi:hypothetical protein